MNYDHFYFHFKTTAPPGPIPPKAELWAPPTHGCVGADGLEMETEMIKK